MTDPFPIHTGALAVNKSRPPPRPGVPPPKGVTLQPGTVWHASLGAIPDTWDFSEVRRQEQIALDNAERAERERKSADAQRKRVAAEQAKAARLLAKMTPEQLLERRLFEIEGRLVASEEAVAELRAKVFEIETGRKPAEPVRSCVSFLARHESPPPPPPPDQAA